MSPAGNDRGNRRCLWPRAFVVVVRSPLLLLLCKYVICLFKFQLVHVAYQNPFFSAGNIVPLKKDSCIMFSYYHIFIGDSRTCFIALPRICCRRSPRACTHWIVQVRTTAILQSAHWIVQPTAILTLIIVSLLHTAFELCVSWFKLQMRPMLDQNGTDTTNPA